MFATIRNIIFIPDLITVLSYIAMLSERAYSLEEEYYRVCGLMRDRWWPSIDRRPIEIALLCG